MTDAAGNTRYAPKQNATPVNTGKSMPEDNTLHAMPKVGDVPNAYGRDASPATLSSEDAIEQALTKAERTV